MNSEAECDLPLPQTSRGVRRSRRGGRGLMKRSDLSRGCQEFGPHGRCCAATFGSTRARARAVSRGRPAVKCPGGTVDNGTPGRRPALWIFRPPRRHLAHSPGHPPRQKTKEKQSHRNPKQQVYQVSLLFYSSFQIFLSRAGPNNRRDTWPLASRRLLALRLQRPDLHRRLMQGRRCKHSEPTAIRGARSP